MTWFRDCRAATAFAESARCVVRGYRMIAVNSSKSLKGLKSLNFWGTRGSTFFTMVPGGRRPLIEHVRFAFLVA